MTKANENERVKYIERITVYRDAAKSILKEEQAARSTAEGKTTEAAIKRLELSEMMLNLASNYIVINGISIAMQDLKDETALNDARKAIYKSVIYLEDTVTNLIDVPFSNYEKQLAFIDPVNPVYRYQIIQKMGLTMQLLMTAYGDNTKWKWTFVELEGRYAAVAKNIINLRDVITNSEPQSPFYKPTVLHLRLARKLLMQAADRYREKYEVSTSRTDDFKLAINFLSSLKRLNTLTGNNDDIPAIQKKLDSWNNKLAADLNKTG